MHIKKFIFHLIFCGSKTTEVVINVLESVWSKGKVNPIIFAFSSIGVKCSTATKLFFIDPMHLKKGCDSLDFRSLEVLEYGD